MPAQRVAFGTSGHRGSSFESPSTRGTCPGDQPGDLRLPHAAGHRWPAVPRHRHARAVRPGVCQRARGAGGQRRRGDARAGRRVHADAGDLPRDHSPTTAAAARDADWPTASSSPRRTIRPTTAASSTTRPTAGRPTPTSPAGSSTRANALLDERAARRSSECRSSQALHAATTHRHDYLNAYVDDLGAGDRPGGDSRRGHPHGRRSARRRRRALLGSDRRALSAWISPSSTKSSIRPFAS